ncbi:hypothetical protein AUQ37_06255 [Candidatus Methanomethylophilus sp. 1R26]|nr:hypothetical protein AUQ37_06255 [Candidatus Methanomethylophilus sp. 1R26]
MKKKLVILGAIAVLFVLSLSGLYAIHDNSRSDVEIIYGSAYDADCKSSVRIDDRNYQNITVDSDLSAHRSSDDEVTCDIYIRATVNEDYKYLPFDLHYSYKSSIHSLIPLDSGRDTDNGPGISCLYKDPVSGDSLQFYESDRALQSIKFTGTTVVGTEGDFQFAQFDLIISYKMDMTYVNSIETQKKDELNGCNLTGEENGAEKSGTVNAYLELNMIVPYERKNIRTEILLEGTEIPAEFLTYEAYVGSETTYQSDNLTPYLRNDGIYIVPQIHYSISVNDTGSLVLEMSGTVTIYGLDDSCNITSKQIIEFEYGAMG